MSSKEDKAYQLVVELIRSGAVKLPDANANTGEDRFFARGKEAAAYISGIYEGLKKIDEKP
ncbi:hypothetical protein [Robbsia andropogonis]|uniref:hypothetical protein n=1 Tax=Robbsia andropogonis TaxID=28092 RepID=UPI000466E802|nr:hypothetical protein [Robbsia andropogonis]